MNVSSGNSSTVTIVEARTTSATDPSVRSLASSIAASLARIRGQWLSLRSGGRSDTTRVVPGPARRGLPDRLNFLQTVVDSGFSLIHTYTDPRRLPLPLRKDVTVLRPGVDASAIRALSTQQPPAATLQPAPAGVSRLLAAHLLERTLLRIGRAGTLVDRRLAPGLQRLRSQRLYRLLGYVRLGDYLTERLGMSLRRCQSILRLERIVESLPGLGLALQAGEVSLSKVESVAGVATAESEAFWLERARSLTVTLLRDVVRAAGAGGDTTAGAVAPADGQAPPAGAAVASASETIEQDEPGRLLSLSAPASVVGVWHWTLDLVRRVAGQQEPAWRCAEYLAAEFLSGVPDVSCIQPKASASGLAQAFDAAVDAKGPHGATGEDRGRGAEPDSGVAGPDASEPAAWIEACDAVREALASLGAAADLAAFASSRLHRELGFASLDDWIGNRLPMSLRRARYLMALDRRLRGLPLVADAYRRGIVSWCQARLLVRVVSPATQSRWIRYARQVTVRRLEEAVIVCEVEGAGAAHVGASPLPPVDPSPGEVGRAPADPACLHTSAPDRPGDTHLHTSAPLSGPEGSVVASIGRQSWRRIAFWAPLDVAALWDSALRACRAAAGTRLDDWECFLLFVRALRDTWDNADDPQFKRRYRIFERDGWRCRVPGCTSRSGLNEHHIIFRSQQGSDDEDNLVTLCVGHHQEGLHARHLSCSGRAPDHLCWELGIRPGGEPLARYFSERVMTRGPRVPLPARVSAGAA